MSVPSFPPSLPSLPSLPPPSPPLPPSLPPSLPSPPACEAAATPRIPEEACDPPHWPRVASSTGENSANPACDHHVIFLSCSSFQRDARARDTGTVKIRRSASDTGDKEELAKMLAARKSAWGEMTLYFGCRRSNMDHIYREELMKAHMYGALTKVNVALSREPDQPKVPTLSCDVHVNVL